MADLIIVSWTPKSKKVFELLASGMKTSEIRKQANVSDSYIYKVKNAMTKGESPGGEVAKVVPGAKDNKKLSLDSKKPLITFVEQLHKVNDPEK